MATKPGSKGAEAGVFMMRSFSYARSVSAIVSPWARPCLHKVSGFAIVAHHAEKHGAHPDAIVAMATVVTSPFYSHLWPGAALYLLGRRSYTGSCAPARTLCLSTTACAERQCYRPGDRKRTRSYPRHRDGAGQWGGRIVCSALAWVDVIGKRAGQPILPAGAGRYDPVVQRAECATPPNPPRPRWVYPACGSVASFHAAACHRHAPPTLTATFPLRAVETAQSSDIDQ